MVVIEMENGKKIKIELYPEIAPITCANFEKLVKEGFYDGLIFHRVISGFMIQGGDPEGFIMHKDAPHLDGGYAAFGKVVDGMDAVDEIADTEVDWNDKPTTPQVMKRVYIED